MIISMSRISTNKMKINYIQIEIQEMKKQEL